MASDEDGRQQKAFGSDHWSASSSGASAPMSIQDHTAVVLLHRLALGPSVTQKGVIHYHTREQPLNAHPCCVIRQTFCLLKKNFVKKYHCRIAPGNVKQVYIQTQLRIGSSSDVVSFSGEQMRNP